MFENEKSYIREKWFFILSFALLTVCFMYFNLYFDSFIPTNDLFNDLVIQMYLIVFDFDYQYGGITELGKNLFGNTVPNFIAYIMLFWYIMNLLVLFSKD